MNNKLITYLLKTTSSTTIPGVADHIYFGGFDYSSDLFMKLRNFTSEALTFKNTPVTILCMLLLIPYFSW